MEENQKASGAFQDILALMGNAYRQASDLRDGLNRGAGARELSLCVTEIDRARHWVTDTQIMTEPPRFLQKVAVPVEATPWLQLSALLMQAHGQARDIHRALAGGVGAREMLKCLDALDEARHWANDALEESEK